MKLSFLKPRFSIRTMLVLMTLFAICGYYLSWIQQRRHALSTGVAWSFDPAFSNSGKSSADAPRVLKLLGEPGYRLIWTQDEREPQSVERLQNLFPESTILFTSGPMDLEEDANRLGMAAALCLVYQYQTSWIQLRRELIASDVVAPNEAAKKRAPGLLFLFGEPGYQEILLNVEPDPSIIARVRALFPEAKCYGN